MPQFEPNFATSHPNFVKIITQYNYELAPFHFLPCPPLPCTKTRTQKLACSFPTPSHAPVELSCIFGHARGNKDIVNQCLSVDFDGLSFSLLGSEGGKVIDSFAEGAQTNAFRHTGLKIRHSLYCLQSDTHAHRSVLCKWKVYTSEISGLYYVVICIWLFSRFAYS